MSSLLRLFPLLKIRSLFLHSLNARLQRRRLAAVPYKALLEDPFLRAHASAFMLCCETGLPPSTFVRASTTRLTPMGNWADQSPNHRFAPEVCEYFTVFIDAIHAQFPSASTTNVSELAFCFLQKGIHNLIDFGFVFFFVKRLRQFAPRHR